MVQYITLLKLTSEEFDSLILLHLYITKWNQCKLTYCSVSRFLARGHTFSCLASQSSLINTAYYIKIKSGICKKRFILLFKFKKKKKNICVFIGMAWIKQDSVLPRIRRISYLQLCTSVVSSDIHNNKHVLAIY